MIIDLFVKLKYQSSNIISSCIVPRQPVPDPGGSCPGSKLAPKPTPKPNPNPTRTLTLT